MSVLEEELDRRASEPGAAQQEQKPMPSAFEYEAAQQATFDQEAEEQAYNNQFSMVSNPLLQQLYGFHAVSNGHTSDVCVVHARE